MLRKLRASSGLSLACAALLLLTVGCVSKPLVQGLNPAGRRAVLLLDASTSMRENDPNRVAQAGASLVMGLAGSEDNVGAITYAASAQVVRPLGAVRNAFARASLEHDLLAVSRNGITNFARAVDKARAMLEAGSAPRGSAVILLTDGVPYRGRRRRRGPSLDDAVDALAAQGWRIFAIALGEDAATPFLTTLVAKTGGAVFAVPDAAGLVGAFQEVALEVLGYLRAERGGREFTVGPHTGRLAFLATWDGAGRIGAVAFNGEPQADGRAIRTAAGAHAVALVERPEPGTWAVEAEGAKEVLALIEPQFGLELLEDEPPATVRSNDPLALAVRLVGDPSALEQLRKRVHLRARLELNDEPWGDRLGLKLDPARADVFVGRLRAPPVLEESTLRLVVEAVLVEADKPFVLRSSRSLTVLPGGGPAPDALELAVTPARLDRARWGDDAAGQATLQVRGDPTRAVTLSCAGKTQALAAGQQATLTVELPSGGALQLSAVSEDGAEWSVSVPVSLRRYTLEAPERVELPPTPAGLALGPVPLPVRVRGGEPSFGSGTLRGPGGARLTLLVGPEGLRAEPAGGLAASDLPPGEYLGELPVRVAGVQELAAARVPVRAQILPPLRAPEVIALEGSWGWVSSAVEVAWASPQEIAVAIRPQALVGDQARLLPRFDLRVEPLDGWSGERLGIAARRFALSVYLSSDLPAGTYTGSVTLEPQEEGGPEPLVIPVRLEVRR